MSKIVRPQCQRPCPSLLERPTPSAAQGHDKMPELGGLAVTVPGSLRGWQLALERFGSWGLDRLLRQPIAYAARAIR
jgi:gamma-glutamyltranspeptidase